MVYWCQCGEETDLNRSDYSTQTVVSDTKPRLYACLLYSDSLYTFVWIFAAVKTYWTFNDNVSTPLTFFKSYFKVDFMMLNKKP